MRRKTKKPPLKQKLETEQFEDTFMHDLYHNTKNPLQVISCSVNMLKRNPDEATRENLYQTIQQNVKKIDETLNEILYVHYSS